MSRLEERKKKKDHTFVLYRLVSRGKITYSQYNQVSFMDKTEAKI